MNNDFENGRIKRVRRVIAVKEALDSYAERGLTPPAPRVFYYLDVIADLIRWNAKRK